MTLACLRANKTTLQIRQYRLIRGQITSDNHVRIFSASLVPWPLPNANDLVYAEVPHERSDVILTLLKTWIGTGAYIDEDAAFARLYALIA